MTGSAKQSILSLRGKMDCFAALAMTGGCFRAASRPPRHCEERSDEAIHTFLSGEARWIASRSLSSGASRGEAANVRLVVFASAAKQSSLSLRGEMDCFAALAMTAGAMDCFAALAMTAGAMDASRSLSSGAHSRGRLAGDDGGGCGVPALAPVIARSVATKQSIVSFWRGKMDCFASLAMTGEAMDASRSLSSGADPRGRLAGDDGGECGVPPLTLLPSLRGA